VPEIVAAPLVAWESFYVIVGSSGGALTGLQFVVLTLVAERNPRTSEDTINAFGTPTIVHFCTVLFVSGVLCAPWPHLFTPALLLGAGGLAGIAYIAITIRRARAQGDYKPVLEDWVWYIILPLVAYVAVLVSALLLTTKPSAALFGIAATSLLLLFIGIRNAWDTVTFVVIGSSEPPST
jgi:hypothetical protein